MRRSRSRSSLGVAPSAFAQGAVAKDLRARLWAFSEKVLRERGY